MPARLWRTIRLLPLLALTLFFLDGMVRVRHISVDPILWAALSFLALAAWWLRTGGVQLWVERER